MKGFRQWRRERHAKHLAQLYRDGFDWAVSAHFTEGFSWNTIESYVEAARANNTYNNFDAGVEAAIEQFGSTK